VADTAAVTVRRAAEGTEAARAVDATKVYGSGETAVRALDGVAVGFGRARFTGIMGPSGT
jgi:putative ABC transport system ATP-binding protein